MFSVLESWGTFDTAEKWLIAMFIIQGVVMVIVTYQWRKERDKTNDLLANCESDKRSEET